MVGIQILLLIMLIVLRRAIKSERLNKPALCAVQTSLATLMVVALMDGPLDTALVRYSDSLRPAALLDRMAMVMEAGSIAIVIFSIWGLIRRSLDRAQGGLSWCISAIVVMMVMMVLSVPNFKGEAKYSRLMKNERQQHFASHKAAR